MEFEVPIDVPDRWVRQEALWQLPNPCFKVRVSPIKNPTLVRTCKAIIDTGASNTHILDRVAQEIGLQRTNGQNAGTMNGMKMLGIFEGFTIEIPQVPGLTLGVEPAMEALTTVSDVEIFIGRNILRHFVLTYDGIQGRVYLAIPEPGESRRLRRVS